MRVLGLTIHGAFSGADAAIFSGLRERGLLAGIAESELPRRVQGALLLRTFSLSRHRWGAAWRTAQIKSPAAWAARTRYNERLLSTWAGKYDVLFQVSGLFAPALTRPATPVVLFCDYTTKLAERNYPAWFGLSDEDAPEWYERETALYQSASMILTASKNTRNSVIADYGIAPARVHVVGEGVTAVCEPPRSRATSPSILFIGIDFVRKGGETLLAAFADVRRRIPSATLHIVGPAAGMPTDGVIWHGHIPDRARLETLFASSTLLALPSICEPFGLALLEGMAHGLPVVGTTVDAMPEIISDGVTGYMVPPSDPKALADRLTTLLEDPLLCDAMGKRGAAEVSERFLWRHVIDRITDRLGEISISESDPLHRSLPS